MITIAAYKSDGQSGMNLIISQPFKRIDIEPGKIHIWSKNCPDMIGLYTSNTRFHFNSID